VLEIKFEALSPFVRATSRYPSLMSIKSQLENIQTRIDLAAKSANRRPEEITLVAVSKTQPLELLQEAYALGIRHFGESRLQEALPKIEAMPKDIHWHFIGTLQSNKAKRIASVFSTVHTFCKEPQVFEADKAQHSIDGFIEVNIASEVQKSGIAPFELDELHAKLLQSKHVHFRGLMTIGPAGLEPEQMRPYFKELRSLAEGVGSESISMGMSGDFEVAIQEGASHIRIGTAIFGSRQ